MVSGPVPPAIFIFQWYGFLQLNIHKPRCELSVSGDQETVGFCKIPKQKRVLSANRISLIYFVLRQARYT